jgi:hypothetical protein
MPGGFYGSTVVMNYEKGKTGKRLLQKYCNTEGVKESERSDLATGSNTRP